jgi:hypothetical protein
LTSSNTIPYSYYRLILEETNRTYATVKRFNLYGYEQEKINTNFENLLANISNKTPYAYFRAEDFIEGTGEIPAKIGNFTAETNGVTLSNDDGNGAIASIPFLFGNTTQTIDFGINVSNSFTICTITRYTGISKRRIINTRGGNWLHGHWGGKIGVSHYNRWLNSNSIEGTNNILINDWIITCGKNESLPDRNFIVNGINRGINSGGDGGLDDLNINKGAYGETSDFAFSKLLIWDKILTDDEMQKVSNYLMQYLKDGVE